MYLKYKCLHLVRLQRFEVLKRVIIKQQCFFCLAGYFPVLTFTMNFVNDVVVLNSTPQHKIAAFLHKKFTLWYKKYVWEVNIKLPVTCHRYLFKWRYWCIILVFHLKLQRTCGTLIFFCQFLRLPQQPVVFKPK